MDLTKLYEKAILSLDILKVFEGTQLDWPTEILGQGDMIVGPPKYVGSIPPSTEIKTGPQRGNWLSKKAFWRARRDSYIYGKGFLRKRWWGWQYLPAEEITILIHSSVKESFGKPLC